MLVLAVVIARDGTGADVGILANRRVTQITEVHGLCPTANPGFFDFHKVANDGACFHLGIHPQVSERPDSTIVGDFGIDDHAVILDRDSIAEPRVLDARPLINFAAITNDRLAFDMHIGMNYAVATDLGFVTYVSVRRIDKGYAFLGHHAPNRATAQKVFELSQLSTGVKAGNFTRILMLIDRNPLAICSQDAGNISQIVLTLTVGRLHAFQCAKELPAIKTINARIDFAKLPLFVTGIPLLDDFREAAVVVAHDASITGRILESDG